MAASSSRAWKTIKLGTRHKTADDFRAAFQAARCYMGDGVHGILDSVAFHCADQEDDIDLVVRSVADLGFQRVATYEEICSRAHELGLELCPAEAGPQLRLQHHAQPAIQWLKIAMEPIINAAARPVIFSVDSCSGARYLGTRYADGFW